MTWRPVMPSDQLWSGEKVGVTIDGQAVLLVHVEGQYHAYEDRCLHRDVPLSGGDLHGTTLRCVLHDWEYDMTTGACINPRQRCLRRYPLQVRDGLVFIQLDDVPDAPALAPLELEDEPKHA